MRLASTLILALSLLGCFPVPHRLQVPEEPQDGLPDALAATVVLTHMGRVTCSAVVLEYFVVSAAHCDDPDVRAHFWNGARDYWPQGFPLKRLYINESQDIVVYAYPVPDSFAGASLSADDPAWGQRVVVIGHPAGLVYSVTTGHVSHPDRTGAIFDNQHWFQVDAPVYPGNSGGPVFNAYGEVLGLVSFHAGANHLAGIVHTEEIRKALKELVRK